MEMLKDRVKKIRRHYEFTQQELADKLGIKRNTVATYESGKSNPSDAAISLICSKLNVNEVWLRTGEGGDDNMFVKTAEDDRYSLNLGKLTMEQNKLVKNAVNYFAESDPEKLKVIEDFMKACLGIE